MADNLGPDEMDTGRGVTSWWETKGKVQTAWALGFAVVFGGVMVSLALAGQGSTVLACCAAATLTIACGYGICEAEKEEGVAQPTRKYDNVLETLRGAQPKAGR